jgi:hypothetical protein
MDALRQDLVFAWRAGPVDRRRARGRVAGRVPRACAARLSRQPADSAVVVTASITDGLGARLEDLLRSSFLLGLCRYRLGVRTRGSQKWLDRARARSGLFFIDRS